ncbi:MAG: hypothetical protein EXR79_10650 [Myxococcales bacterium]|nr:hypothetical protein [Myxococcales bacterium]
MTPGAGHGGVLVAGWAGVAALAWGCAAAANGTPATYADVKAKVFVSCVFSTCHKGASPAGGLGLDGDARAQLVDKAAAGEPTRKRVVAGDPAASYLMDKLTQAKPAVGDPMPPGGALEAERIEMVRSWIAAGAKAD